MSCTNPFTLYLNREAMHGEKVKFPKNRSDEAHLLTLGYKSVEVPCGNCLACKYDYSKQWSLRNLKELEHSRSGYFITLTYSDSFLTFSEKHNIATLVPFELSDFIKKYRTFQKSKYNNDNIRFFACGEYGDHTFRPHYHVLLYNAVIPDLEFFTSSHGNSYYLSREMQRIWKHGNIIIGDITVESASYVAGYCTKKVEGYDSKLYQELDVQPEFLRMSRRPGIGYLDNDTVLSLYEHDEIFGKNGVRMKPPRYYDKILEKLNPDLLEDVKDFRLEKMFNYRRNLKRLTDLDLNEYRELENEILLRKSKKKSCF